MNVVVVIGVSAVAGVLGGAVAWLLFGPSHAAMGAGPAAGITAAILFGRYVNTRR